MKHILFHCYSFVLKNRFWFCMIILETILSYGGGSVQKPATCSGCHMHGVHRHSATCRRPRNFSQFHESVLDPVACSPHCRMWRGRGRASLPSPRAGATCVNQPGAEARPRARPPRAGWNPSAARLRDGPSSRAAPVCSFLLFPSGKGDFHGSFLQKSTTLKEAGEDLQNLRALFHFK